MFEPNRYFAKMVIRLFGGERQVNDKLFTLTYLLNHTYVKLLCRLILCVLRGSVTLLLLIKLFFKDLRLLNKKWVLLQKNRDRSGYNILKKI